LKACVFNIDTIYKSFIKKMTERTNLAMKKWTKCNQNNTLETRNINT